jgi:processive 1,2-diacylglycerol beta-glucosyltransferase
MGKKVLILSASAGQGHVRAASALEKVFAEQPDVSEVINIDSLKFTNKLFRDFYSKMYLQLVNSAPSLLGWLYKTSDEPWKTDRMRFMLDRLNTGPLIKFISDFNPDVTVCTHFLPSEIISHLISKKKLQAQLSIVVTDFDCHAMWLSKVFHRYFVALEETKVHLECLGLPADRITVSGIPIDPVFKPFPNRAEAQREAGLDPNLPVLLVSAGAFGVSPTEFILNRLYQLRKPAQVVLICGKNEALKTRIERAVKANKGKHLQVKTLGYTNEMHRWMGVSDMFIGKPGGLTTSEALAMGLPMVIISPIPGQEERNSDHLLEKGIALKCNEFTTLPYKISQLLDNPKRLNEMRENALKYGRPDAALTIVRRLLQDELAQKSPILVNREQQKRMLRIVKPSKV